MTAAMMVEGAGERKLRENRRRFQRLVGVGIALGAGCGIVIGFLTSATRQGGWSAWLIWAALAAMIAAFIWYTAVYFRRVDELDVLDNLWSSLIGFYAFMAALPMWAALHEIGQLPAPHVEGLYALSIGAAVLAYGWRKLRARF